MQIIITWNDGKKEEIEFEADKSFMDYFRDGLKKDFSKIITFGNPKYSFYNIQLARKIEIIDDKPV